MRAIFAGSSDTTCPANRVVGDMTATAHKAAAVTALINVRKLGFLFISPLRFEGGTFTSPACCSFSTHFFFFGEKMKPLLILFQELLDERFGRSLHFPH